VETSFAKEIFLAFGVAHGNGESYAQGGRTAGLENHFSLTHHWPRFSLMYKDY
jgi:hypothetical protein